MAKITDWLNEHVFFTDRLGVEKKSLSPDQVRNELLGATYDAYDNAVTLETALQCTTVLACARVIAEGLAQVPCELIRPKDAGGKQVAFDHPVHRLLSRKPNDWQTPFEFREQIGIHLTLTNNAYVFVNRDTNGKPIELFAYDPRLITVVRQQYSNDYYVTDLNGKKTKIPAQNMWHIKGASMDGFIGMDAIKNAREAIGLALATVKFGANLFKNGARPSGLLSTDLPLTPEQNQALKDAWQRAHQGASNSLKTAVLGNGMKYTPLSSTPDEAQFIQTRELQIEEICRLYRVQPIMVMHQQKGVSYNSIEQLQLSHLQHTLGPWFERFEQSAENALLTEAELNAGYEINLNTRGMLKGSAAERAAYYGTMRANGLMTANECRDLEGMDRIDDPTADQLTPAANLFGNPMPPPKPLEEIAK